MKKIMEEKGPIGFWVKKADDVFTHITRKTKNNGTFNRLDWQFFNYLKGRNQVPENEARDFLSFFGDELVIQQAFERFQNDGLLITGPGVFTITGKGNQVFDEVMEIQEEIKEKAMTGITETEYRITVEALQKMIDNLKEFYPGDKNVDEGKTE